MAARSSGPGGRPCLRAHSTASALPGRFPPPLVLAGFVVFTTGVDGAGVETAAGAAVWMAGCLAARCCIDHWCRAEAAECTNTASRHGISSAAAVEVQA